MAKIGWMVLALAFIGGVRPASATTVTGGCIDDLYPGNLNCTASDVQISRARDLVITDPCEYPGDTVTFSATFDVVLNATTRYDVGLFFSTDADPNNNGALTGTCSITTLPTSPDPPFVNIDGDQCGDINSAHSPMSVRINNLTATCIDTDGDGLLNLPYCTSWRQGANDPCNGPLQAFPGSPSKCRCDKGFNIPVPVPPARLTVVKTANPTSVSEPGGTVQFTVAITNGAPDPNNPVTIDTLGDDVYGNLLDPSNPQVSSNTCASASFDRIVGAAETVTCMFNAVVAGNAGQIHTDTVTASGLDRRTPPNRASGHDDATVTITDVVPAIAVKKTANPTQLLEPGGNVTFTVAVKNNSVASDPVTITSLMDNVYGSLNGKGTCAVPQTIAAGGTYTCSFIGAVVGNAGGHQTDVVTAAGADDEGDGVMASDSATVNIADVPSMISLTKTASPTSVNEPGASVTFTFTVRNTSTVDTETISSLTDTIYGNLNGKGTCAVPQTIAAGGSYSCSFSAFVAGNAGQSETNEATASGLDDDGNPVSATDDATVTINNVPPAATLTKTATMAVVTFQIVVTNDSSAEPLGLSALRDDQFGDITTSGHDGIVSTTCAVPRAIPVGGRYTCSFNATVTTSPHTNTVTGTISDDDGGTITRSGSATVQFQ